MNIIETIANNPQIMKQIAGQFNLSDDQAQSVINPLLGQVAGAFKSNLRQEGGLESLLGALGNGNHNEILSNISGLASGEATQTGNGILGHLFGGKEGSREVAKQAAQESGVDYGISKQILPLIAKLAMGGLSQKSGVSSGLSANRSQLTGLASFLDTDGDGSIIDDVMGLASKFLQ